MNVITFNIKGQVPVCVQLLTPEDQYLVHAWTFGQRIVEIPILDI